MRARPFAAVSCFLAATAFAKTPAPAPPPPERLPELAAALAAHLAGVEVALPDGGRAGAIEALDAKRAEQALKTMGDAQAWPAAWLVVQDLGKPWDLVLRIELGADGTLLRPATVFAAARREWDDAAFDAAYQAAVGAKPPRDRNRNLVVQGFARRTETVFVYDLPATGAGAKGLMALLPEGSLLRESKAVRWTDGRLFTVAIVLVRPKFVPSACGKDDLRDHADSGGVMLYLAGEKSIEGSLDLTESFREEPSGQPMVPHWACAPGDGDPALKDRDPVTRFGARPQVRLIATFRPEDGDEAIGVRIVGVDRGRGRRERALVRIAASDDGKGLKLVAE
ncbi:MAG TPA: hypothetical protein VF139_07260 [Candidatus Polarisedimenticolaceae bacterium]